MSVLFFVPDQRDAWERINKEKFATMSAKSGRALEGMWSTGKMGIHEMATEDGTFGYLVLGTVDLGLGKWLHVFWCEVRPHRTLRRHRDWLWEATRYLAAVAEAHECLGVKINVAEDHPSRKWKRRLQGVGFQPSMAELSMKVAA